MAGIFGRTGNAATPKARWSRSFGFYAFLAAIIGIFSLVVATLVYVIGMISVIGIPLAIAALFIPTLCLWIVISYAAHKINPLRTKVGVAGSFVIGFLVMLAVPQLYNLQVNRAVATLQSGDIAPNLQPLRGSETLVVARYSRGLQKCFNTCIDLLLSRQVREYVVANLPRNTIIPTGDMRAMRYRLVRSTSCDETNILPRNRTSNQDKPGTVAYRLTQAAKSGICIKGSEISTDDLGAVRTVVDVQRKQLDYPKSAFFIDTEISPYRVATYLKSADHEWTKTSQQTNVSYSLLRPVLAHAISGGVISSLRSGWWRERIRAQPISFQKYMVQNMGAKLLDQ